VAAIDNKSIWSSRFDEQMLAERTIKLNTFLKATVDAHELRESAAFNDFLSEAMAYSSLEASTEEGLELSNCYPIAMKKLQEGKVCMTHTLSHTFKYLIEIHLSVLTLYPLSDFTGRI
jgi:hypothetical protein